MAEQIYFALDPNLAQLVVTYLGKQPYEDVHQLIGAVVQTPQVKLDLQKIMEDETRRLASAARSKDEDPAPAATNGHKKAVTAKP